MADIESITDTVSSATTEWGPGTLSGRAIKSLGEASLRGFDKLLVRYRLAKIHSNLQSQPVSYDKMLKIHDDLLEMSRMDVYDYGVRHKALRIILMQVGSRETVHLTTCITKWPQEDIQVFLSEIIPCIPLVWYARTSVFTLNSNLRQVQHRKQTADGTNWCLPGVPAVRTTPCYPLSGVHQSAGPIALHCSAGNHRRRLFGSP